MKPLRCTHVIVTQDIPEQDILMGDIATLVDYIEHPHDGEEGAVLELFNLLGESVGILTVPASAIETVSPARIPSARQRL